MQAQQEEQRVPVVSLTKKGPVKSRPRWVEQSRPFRAALLRVASPYFGFKETRCEAYLLSLALLTLLLVESLVGVAFSRLAGNYMTALQKRDAAGFYRALGHFGGIIVVRIVTSKAHGLTRSFIRLRWSSTLTQYYSQLYLVGADPRSSSGIGGSAAFYSLHLEGGVDNPDERIVDETWQFVDTALTLFESVIGNILKILAFGHLLRQISRRAFFGTFGYAFAGTIVAVQIFASKLMHLQQAKAEHQANLRYSLIRVRENAESIAFFGGGASEFEHFQRYHRVYIATSRTMILWSQAFSTFLSTYNFATYAVGPLLVGPAYLRGEVEFGAITQASIAFGAIKDGLSFFINRLPSMANIAANADRLNSLDEALHSNLPLVPPRSMSERSMRQLLPTSSSGMSSYIDFSELPLAANQPLLQLCSVTLKTPQRAGSRQHTLIADLSFEVREGMSVLVVGASGVGKSSLLRAIAGLWRSGSGSVSCCSRSSAFFMPQRPYMVLGSLREQLLYPDADAGQVSDAVLVKSLQQVRLGYLLERYDLNAVETWATTLSLGEQQRVGFARMLLKDSLHLAFIDEGTSALDSADEAHLYGLLASKLRSYVSVGHRPTLRQCHSHVLLLQQQPQQKDESQTSSPGHWRFMTMDKYEDCGSNADQQHRTKDAT